MGIRSSDKNASFSAVDCELTGVHTEVYRGSGNTPRAAHRAAAGAGTLRKHHKKPPDSSVRAQSHKLKVRERKHKEHFDRKRTTGWKKRGGETYTD